MTFPVDPEDLVELQDLVELEDCTFVTVMYPVYRGHKHYSYGYRSFPTTKWTFEGIKPIDALSPAKRFAEKYNGKVLIIKTFKDCTIKIEVLKEKKNENADLCN